MRKASIALAFLMAASLTSFAFQQAPKASAKALGVTRGKSFSSGMVFVNGKYLAPPYVVERWGTGLRINGTPVTGQVIDWNEFLKTQPNVKVVKTETKPAQAEPPLAVPVAAVQEATDTLDDLFDDEPQPAKKKGAAKLPRATAARPRSQVSVSYELEGPFVPNETTKALLARINDERTKIDRVLRLGGFIFFGDAYSRVTGDARTLTGLLDALPELQQNATSAAAFSEGVNAANLFYVNGLICQELYANRIDYRKLKERRDRIRLYNLQ